MPLDQAVDGSSFGEKVLSVYRATNLLSAFEQTRMRGVLRGPQADAFVRAAAWFTLDPCKAHLRDMEAALRRDDNAKWTVVTYLPFLWAPETHMFLKPEVTKDFAARVGHRFVSDEMYSDGAGGNARWGHRVSNGSQLWLCHTFGDTANVHDAELRTRPSALIGK